MMLEDDFTDVLRKAMTGHGFGVAALAQRAGLAEEQVESLLGGRFSESELRRLAAVLGIDGVALAGLPAYVPRALDTVGVRRLDLPFGAGRVNAWWIESGETALVFDTGHEAEDLDRALDAAGLRRPGRVFITHGHRDHVGGIGPLLASGIPVHGAALDGGVPMVPGDTLACGPLVVTACDLSGHAAPALGFRVDGLGERPVLVVGDALFAGSMGGCRSVEAFQHALVRLHEVLADLPDATLILPGHGPATTLGEERRANPFLATE